MEATVSFHFRHFGKKEERGIPLMVFHFLPQEMFHFSGLFIQMGRAPSNRFLSRAKPSSRDGAVVRVLVSHQCGPGSIPGGLSLLLVRALL